MMLRYLGFLSVVLALGCGGGSELPEGETGTVSGMLTLDGKPATAGLSVIFIPKSKGLSASGTVDETGAFTMKTRGEDQIMVGEYSVGVSPPTVEMTPEQEEAANMGTYEEPTYDIPAKYLVPESSGITFSVKPGPNTYDLEMVKE